MKNNWRVKKLGDVAEYINGYPFSPEEWSGSGLPIIRIQNLNDSNKSYNYFSGNIGKKYRVNPGDILISWSASLGVYLWNKKQAWLNQHIFKVIVDGNKIDNTFFFYLAQTKLGEMKNRVHGGTMQHITKNEFEKVEMLVPPINIQQKIVERLDAIKKAQELCDQQIQKTEELFESVLNNLSLVKNTNYKTLSEITDLITDFVANGSFASLRENVKYNRNEDFAILIRLLDHSNKFRGPYVYINEHAYNFLSKSKLRSGDLILSNVGANLGTIFRAPNLKKPMSLGPNAVLVRSKKYDKFIYFWLLSSIGKRAIRSVVSQTGQPKFNKTDLRNIKISVPQDKELQKIIEKLDVIQEYKKLLQKQKQLYKELFDSVLDKSMKGELDN